jgi:cyclophilin family peptidyl-prolyl cis-trans isomerase
MSRSPLNLTFAAVATALLGWAAEARPDDASAGALTELRRAWARIGDLEKELETLAAEFRDPKTAVERRTDVADRVAKLRSEHDAVWERVVAVFPAAHRGAPKDPFVVEKLPRMLRIFLQYHKLDEALRLSEVLAADGKGADASLAHQVAAVVHLAHNRFAKAGHAFLKARELGEGRLDPQFAPFEKTLAQCLELWDAENAVREREKAADDLPRVLLKTSRGEVTLELFENEAPGTVANFVHLVEKGFYNGTAFHRVVPLFMAQGGDPNTLDDDPANDGRGGPGYTIPCECKRKDARIHFAGSLSMAHKGRDTGGSQFFITQLPAPHLNGEHTVFGRVLEGLNAVRGLKAGDKVLEARVLRKRAHAYEPVKNDKNENG